MRSILVVVFLALGALLTLSANATIWVDRTVFNTDEFVGTVREVLDDEEVQQELAVRLSNRLVVQGDVEARIQESLPDGLKFMAPLLAVTAQDVIEKATLRILQSEEIAQIVDTALTQVHKQVVYIIEGEGALTFEDDKVILDLRPVLERVADQLGVDRENGLLAGVEIPDDAGQIVLVEDAPKANSIQELMSYHSQIVWAVVGAALACFAIAVLFARDRRAAVRNVGALITVCGFLAIFLLVPIRPIVTSFADNGEAARVIFDAFVDRFTVQSFALVLLGLLTMGAAALAGDGGVAVAIRRSVRRDPGSPAPDLGAEVRANAAGLRITGFVVGALLLVAWPNPTSRTYVTTLVILAAYFGAIWLITSDSSVATRLRGQIGKLVGAGAAKPANASWFGRNATALRVAGVVVALILLVSLPNLQLRSFVGVVALTLGYLAGIDWLAGRSDEADGDLSGPGSP